MSKGFPSKGINPKNLIEYLSKWSTGPWTAPSQAKLDKLVRRDSLESFLPWMAYYEKDGIYFLEDDSVGFLWECVPHCYSSDSAVKKLESIFRDVLPENTVISFILHADDHLDPILEAFKGCKKRKLPIIQEAAEELANYFNTGAKGLSNMQGIPVRHFRLFVSVKIPAEAASKAKLDLVNLKVGLAEKLKSAGFGPDPMKPEHLLEWFRRLTDPEWGPTITDYDPDLPINRQAIRSNTVIEAEMEQVRINDRYFLCQTVKKPPRDWDVLRGNKILGGIDGIISDSSQITTPFLLCVNLVIRDLRKMLHGRSTMLNNQKSFGTFGKTLQAMRDEHSWALTRYEDNEKFVLCMPIFWTWGKNREELEMISTRVKTLWENEGFIMQRDRGILTALFLSALPFGLRTQGNMVEKLQRDFPVPAETAVKLLPTQGDFNGVGIPSLLFVGRKGQLTMMDFINKTSTNSNGFVAAGSGGGKSFLMNYLLFNYFGMGAKIRIIDIGASYKKASAMLGAKYMDFTPEQAICVNPFGTINDEDQESFDKSVDIVARIIGMMAVTKRELSETELTLFTEAIIWTWELKGAESSIDDIRYFMDHLDECYLDRRAGKPLPVPDTPSLPTQTDPIEAFLADSVSVEPDTIDKEQSASKDSEPKGNPLEVGYKTALIRMGHSFSTNLSAYGSEGRYGKWFNGPSTFDIGQDDFVVLELEHLKAGNPLLFDLITTIVINATTANLYLSDRKDPRIILFDEAWQFLKPGSLIAKVIEEGYRRARKYNGAFIVVTQSILDLQKFGEVGDVINASSSYKWFLASTDFDRALDQKLIDYDPFTMQILKSIQTKKGEYSEVFVKTDKSFGVARLAIDPFSYFVYTSDPDDVAAIEQIVEEGMSYPDAIRELIKRRGR